MTGFGSADRGGFRVEIRSLNHRFMDISIKLPPALGRHEIPLRDILKQKFSRGKFDVYISVTSDAGVSLSVNKEAAKKVFDALNDLKEGLSLDGDIDIGMLLGWKELFMTEEVSYDADALYEAFREAANGVEGMRLREGETLAAELVSRADKLDALNNEIISLCPSVMKECRDRFLQRLKEFLPEGQYDEIKLIQEASTASEKADITEEVTRLKSHIEQLKKILTDGGTIGRKLDFLLQELNREANTIASKASDSRILNIVIEMKAEIEKMREQVQNIQ
jgi:uncharacterized protein (TIGR00255 family)